MAYSWTAVKQWSWNPGDSPQHPDPAAPRRRSRDQPATFRIVLVGHDWHKTNKVGNLLLGRDAFETKSGLLSRDHQRSPAKKTTMTFTGCIPDTCIFVINTADMFTPDISDDDPKQKVKECVSLCAPGPHALVLVVNPKDFDAVQSQKLEKIVTSFSEQAFQHSIAFIFKEQKEHHDEVKNIITKCGGGFYQYNKHDQTGALKVIEQMITKNDWRYITCVTTDMDTNGSRDRSGGTKALNIVSSSGSYGQMSSTRLNLVLCGSSATAKASAADLILGEKSQPSSAWVKREAEVHGCHITLFLLPSLGNTQQSEDALLQETHKCLYLCDPGVHAFIFVIAQTQLTHEDKEEWERIKHFFGEEVGNCRKTVLTMESEAADGVVIAHNVQETSQGSYHILDNSSKVVSLLEEVKKMRGTVCYTSDMAIAAQLNSHLKCHSELKDIKMRFEKLQSEMGSNQGLQEDSESLRIVLLGKTGEGKSATGNTILGRDVFKEHFSFKSVTTVCQKETVKFNGRLVTVVDTPGLFDTGTDNEEIKKEIIKCIGMAAPGPHAFVFVKALGRFTQEQRDTVKMVQTIFGDESGMYMLVLFTGGDKLQSASFDEHLQEAGSDVSNLLRRCGNRYHVFDNTDKSNRNQVNDFLSKIDSIVKVNKGKCYTNETFERVEEKLKQEQERILREREEEIKKEKEELQAKHEAEMEKLKKGMEEERRRQDEEGRRREEEFKNKEQDLKAAMLQLEQDERAKALAMKEEYEWRKRENEDWIQQRTIEVQMERQRQNEEWETKRKAEQKKREEEEEERKNKELVQEKEWQERQRQEQEEFKVKMEQILKESKEEETKRKQEYEDRVRKEEEKQKELEEKIKHAEQSKMKELEDQKRKHEEDCQKSRLEEEKRKNEWKHKLESMEANWQKKQRQEKERYEMEKREEKQRREKEEAQRKLREEEERKKIELDVQKKIKEKEDYMKKLQDECDKKLQEEENKLSQQREETEARLRLQREQFEEQKKKEAIACEERERRNIEYLKEQHEKEQEKLKRETEIAARNQAEKEFNEELDRKVKEAKIQGHGEGYREGHQTGKTEGEREGHRKGKEEGHQVGYKEGKEAVQQTRTTFGKLIDGLLRNQNV